VKVLKIGQYEHAGKFFWTTLRLSLEIYSHN